MSKLWRPALLALLACIALAACKDKDEDSTLTDNPEDFDDLKPFNSSATYSSVLKECVTAEETNDLCTLSKLPLLGQEVDNPTVDDIMNRLVISHDWMADNFEEILYSLPADILPLFKALTAVVIDDDIRPAFYTTSTGAIYLDPAYLWMTVADKQTINPKQDYRAGFGNALILEAWGYYTDGNDYAFRYGSLTDDSERSLEDTTHLLARLIFHELAHANDFIPQGSYGSMDNAMTVSQVSSALAEQRPSNVLDDDYPLNSSLLYGLADVLYFGETASAAQSEISAEQAGNEFEPDGASDHYGYSNQYEDAAMLFETSLMKFLFGFDYDTSFVAKPEVEDGCDSYIVEWGQFNRLGDTNVKTRAQYIVGEILPNLDTTMFFQDLETPTDMTSGIGWCENLAAKGGGSAMDKLQKPSSNKEWQRSQRDYL